MSADALFDAREFASELSLADRFGVPPFTVLDTTSGTWKTQRRSWEALDLESLKGRGANLLGWSGAVPEALVKTSQFDPLLCELALRWWSPADGIVLDPFAGGSTRGCVSAVLGREYHGVDLSAAQIEANEATARRLAGEFTGPPPRWYENDSARWQPEIAVDFILSCPPYGALERYSDHPNDLSTMRFEAFRLPYKRAVAKAVDRLKRDRFAVFVVGNYRERDRLCDLVGLTVEAFGEAGADYYGDLVLRNSVGSAAMRVSGSFPKGRKPMPIHQHVCVFVKGDWRKAAAAAEYLEPASLAAAISEVER